MNNSRATVKLMVRGFALLSGCVTHLELLDLILEPFRFGVCFGDLLRQRRHITVRGSSKIPSSLFAFFQCRRNWTSRPACCRFWNGQAALAEKEEETMERGIFQLVGAESTLELAVLIRCVALPSVRQIRADRLVFLWLIY